jgi:hypothetical protein
MNGNEGRESERGVLFVRIKQEENLFRLLMLKGAFTLAKCHWKNERERGERKE